MMVPMNEGERLRRARVWIVVFVIGLVAAGLTAFPLVTESGWLVWWATDHGSPLAGLAGHFPAGVEWARRVHTGLAATARSYPFLAYGTDWLAFAHLVIAVAFVGPLRDPVRNVWVLDFGLIACAAILPLAAVCGPLRGLPLWWLPIDMSFGVFGAVPLWLARRHVKAVERSRTATAAGSPAVVSGL
jgi:hypothetical protein